MADEWTRDEEARIRARHAHQIQRLDSYTEHERMLIEDIGTLLAEIDRLYGLADEAKVTHE